ncbi:MAG TPA: hypothetical protein PLA19_02530 [Candidatus Pacearchaeota archaeon]|nr:hypothetical protein [Candidatus Pacearchaeota archaeon]
MAVELGWRDNPKVVVKKRGQGILVEDWDGASENYFYQNSMSKCNARTFL